MRWYRIAAKQGNVNAQSNFGLMYAEGKGVSQDVREAVRWYRMAAEQGLAAAQNNLGRMYFKGKGAEGNVYESYIWLSIAKASGSEEAIRSFPKVEWHLFLTASEIKNAKQEATRRLEEIDNRAVRN